MSVLAILWKMYPLCSYGLLQAANLFQGLKMSQLWEAASTILAEKHQISALISMRCWSAGPGIGSHLHEEKGKAILCEVMCNSVRQSFLRVPAQGKRRVNLPAQSPSAESQQQRAWQRQDISVTGGNKPRCSKFPSADSVTRLSTQIKRIDIKKDNGFFFFQVLRNKEIYILPLLIQTSWWNHLFQWA